MAIYSTLLIWLYYQVHVHTNLRVYIWWDNALEAPPNIWAHTHELQQAAVHVHGRVRVAELIQHEEEQCGPYEAYLGDIAAVGGRWGDAEEDELAVWHAEERVAE